MSKLEGKEKMKIWKESYGSRSDSELEAMALGPFLQNLEQQGKIGNIVVDVGSGEYPISGYFRDYNRKLISIDLCGETKSRHTHQRIKGDIENIGNKSSLEFRKAIIRICKFLDIDLLTEKNIEQADTMLFSYILNYVDYQLVLDELAKYLKPGGRFIVFNKPGLTLDDRLLSERGVKSNSELCKFLGDIGFEIETKIFPEKSSIGNKSEDQEMIMLVARKIKRKDS